MQIIGDDKAGTRAQVMAARALVQLEAQNQADEHLDIKYERADQGLPEETIVLKATFDE